MVLRPDQRAILAPLARRYIWWQPPERSLDHPHRLLAQVMNIGDWHDAEPPIGPAIPRTGSASAPAVSSSQNPPSLSLRPLIPEPYCFAEAFGLGC
jgi:hypothetical protein